MAMTGTPASWAATIRRDSVSAAPQETVRKPAFASSLWTRAA
jgi:hypothetical protein